ncbi:Poly [ADP-ribose] polymerase 2 [Quaeritorhiza haematococci]|nr:Poly [ADP-ribose] polymerase 2 [Quaeritorhiza haematococci]
MPPKRRSARQAAAAAAAAAKADDAAATATTAAAPADPEPEKKKPATRGRGRGKAKATADATPDATPEDSKDSSPKDTGSPVDDDASTETKKGKGKGRGKATKRKIDDVDDEAATDNKDTKDDVEVPKIVKAIKKGRAAVDHLCPVARQVHVYESGQDVFGEYDHPHISSVDVMLNQTDIKNNNNKFYVLQLLEADSGGRYHVWTRWGRVGYDGQNKLEHCGSLASALASFKKKFSDKTKNQWDDRADFVKYPGKYFLMERDYGDDEEEKDSSAASDNKEPIKIPESKLDERVQELIKLITNTEMMTREMVEIGYDAKKMPLGKLTKQHIEKGYNVLKEIAEELNKPSRSNSRLTDLTSEFYTIIPHEFGMRTPPVINTPQMLKSKLQMVEALADIQIATTLLKSTSGVPDANPIDVHYEALHCDLAPIDKNSDTFELIKRYTQNTHAATHNAYKLEVDEVFEVVRDGEVDKYEKVKADIEKKKDNRMLLWHGSRLTNFVGILSQGLRIAPPEAPVTGYMFGKGVYFADMVSKSANYCFTSPHNPTGLMLLCEVQLGEPRPCFYADYDAGTKAKAGGLHSTKGCGSTAPDESEFVKMEDGVVVPCGKPTNVKKSEGSLLYNEYIVYDVAQIRMRYLIKMKFKYGR